MRRRLGATMSNPHTSCRTAPAVVFRRQPFGGRLPRAFEHFDGLEVRLGNSNYYCRVRVGGGASAWSKAVCSWGCHRQLLSEFGQVEYA